MINDDNDSNYSNETCESISSVPTDPITVDGINMAPIIISSDSSDSNVEVAQSSSSQLSTIHKKKRGDHSNKRKRAISDQSSDEDVLIEKALACMEQKSDELDLFGQYIASELRRISDSSTRNVMKLKITAVLMGFASDSIDVQQASTGWTSGSFTFEEMPTNSMNDFI